MNYKQQKADFLDNLQPDDFRNGGSFNQAEMIFDELNQAFLQATIEKKNPEEFIAKALRHLFRENSPAIAKAIDVANAYVAHEIKKTAGIKARQKVDIILQKENLEEVCDKIVEETFAVCRDLEDEKRREYILNRVVKFTDKFRQEKDFERAASMLRYTIEGGHYDSSNNDELVRYLINNYSSSAILDLGAGNASLLNKLKKNNFKACGIDLSSSFVANNSDLFLAMIDQENIDDILADLTAKNFKPDLIITSLTLDRVSNPTQLLKNIFLLAKNFNSDFIILTLLPINPVDDDKSEYKIIYSNQKITPQSSGAKRDEQYIKCYLEIFAQKKFDLTQFQINYGVNSFGENNHKYTLHGFRGSLKKAPLAEDDGASQSKSDIENLLKMADEDGCVEIADRVAAQARLYCEEVL